MDLNKKITQYDKIRYELFEILLSKLLYEEQNEGEDYIFENLKSKGAEMVYNMFREMCVDDKISCPYVIDDFSSKFLNEGGIGMVQINLPAYNPAISDIVRAYLLFCEDESGTRIIRYFAIKRFRDGSYYILFVPPKGKALLGEQVFIEDADMDYEHWQLARTFVQVIVKELETGEKKE